MKEMIDPVPLPNVNTAILKKAIQWCTHHKDDPLPPEDEENRENEQMIYLWIRISKESY